MLLLSAPGALRAEPSAGGPPGALRDLALSVQRVELDNGLRVVLNPDRRSPSVAVAVVYQVGSRDESPGRTGFAHLFEHMMFQGSANVAKGEHFTWITARGGTLNGTTSTDRTNYFETLPASELSLALFLEADRMATLAVTQENLDNQRAVVKEEYRMRVSNQAYAEGSVRLRALAFEGHVPYAHDPIGSLEDLERASIDEVRAFHDAHYVPGRAVVAISGDFDVDRALAEVRDRFGGIPAGRPAPALVIPQVPAQTAPRRAEVTDTNARTPAVLRGWVVPPRSEAEHRALDMAVTVL
ncbi:MAG: insulinase family protein, partial [Deltaproteobacteria bacterium]|nr:insulinase family protein [Deltaproteobacteria bacterium]